jgi:hypothetical protein
VSRRIDTAFSISGSASRKAAPAWAAKATRRFRLIAALLALTLVSFAQDTRATLGGRVLDPQGAAISGAKVTVTAEATGIAVELKTNEYGNWRLPFIAPGPYRFQVEAPGFEASKRGGIQLQVADQKIIDTTLVVGSSRESIVVEGAAPLVDTSAATSGTVITTAQLGELPSMSNIPTTLAGLTPGVVIGDPNGGSAHLWSNISASDVTVNGSGVGTRSMNYTLDGASNVNSAGQVTFIPPMEAVSEFRVTTNAYDAAIGNQGSATINMSLKSGTMGFHGSLYENNQNNILNARRFESLSTSPLPAIHVNEWGGTFGGPVLLPKVYDGRKRRTFAFVSYDGIRNATPVSGSYMAVPTMAERTGDFSKSFVVNSGTKYSTAIYDPSSINLTNGNRQQFPGNIIPTSRLNPISAAILNLMPAPNTPNDASSSSGSNFLSQAMQRDKFASLAAKFNQTWNDSHSSYVSIRYNNFSETSQDNLGAGNPLQGLNQFRTNKGITVDHTWVVSATNIVDFRYNVTGYMYRSASPGTFYDPTQLKFPSSFVGLMDTPSIPLITGIASGTTQGGLGSNKKNFNQDTFQTLAANLAHTTGNHSFRYGVEYGLQQQGVVNLNQPGGTFAFGSNWSTLNPTKTAAPGEGSSMASFVLGLPTSGSIPTNATAFWSQHSTAFYFQDDWRVTSKLTIDLGLRWDFVLPTSERYDRYSSRFDPSVNLTPITAYAQPKYSTLITGAPANSGVQFLQQYRPDASTFVARGGPLYAGVNGTSSNLYDTTFNKYWQPRLGFAYRLTKDTVVRGGLGRFVQSTFDTAGQDGYSQTTTLIATTDSFYTPSMSFNNLYPAGKVAPTGSSNGVLTNPGSITSYTNAHTGRRPFVDEASVHVQRQLKNYLFEVGGTLNLTHDILLGYNVNNPGLDVWKAAYGPQFDSAGRPVDTLPGAQLVNNPFYGNTSFLNTLGTSKTIGAYQLARPNPMVGDQWENMPIGKATYYALQAKVERRLGNGFSLLQSFTWSKKMYEGANLGSSNNVGLTNILAQAPGPIRQLDTGDRRFMFVTAATYTLPFGQGKWLGKNANGLVDRLIGGWEIAGIYSFASGTPVTLPTNSSFFNPACSPSLGSDKTLGKWFNTSCFVPFPNKSTSYADLHDSTKYPSWTGVQNLPGYNWQPTSSSDGSKNGVYQDFTTWSTYNPTVFGNIRSPWSSDLTLGVRKNIRLTERAHLQLRMDAFNALNHPRFNGPNTSPTNVYFGVIGGSSSLSQANAPRAIQLAGKITF